MDLGLTGTVAIVTGASRGIGRAVAETFAAEGADVVLTARSATDLENATNEITSSHGTAAVAVARDLSLPQSPAEVVEAAIDRFGRVDTLVNVAGAAAVGRIGEIGDEDWEAAFGLKFMATVRGCRAVLPVMRERGAGSVVNIGGIAGWQPRPNQVAVGAVNAALFNLTRALAREAADRGVRVNTVVPGSTRTDRFQRRITATAAAEGISEDDVLARTVEEIPDGRPGEPAEVAAAVAYLASRRALHINGVVLEVDGGQTRGMH